MDAYLKFDVHAHKREMGNGDSIIMDALECSQEKEMINEIMDTD